jgi:choline dehydrogenase
MRLRPGELQAGLIRVLDDKPGITGGPWQMRPLSRGYVRARSPDPHEQPAINPRYLAEDTDRRAMIGGLKFLRRLFAAPSFAKHIVVEKMPGPGVQSDDELLDYARQNGSTLYHASCTCTMGGHAMSIVDSELKVRGLGALRVIDASIMPAVSSTNINAPTIMIAKKGAAMIEAETRRRLAA